jgi:peptidoglycan/LPS O-acetylase OafA/YrhL
MSSQFSYRPEIDGLRAVAVLAVIIFHLDSTLIPGGFMGVDVFFVISGYLITKIIKREYDTKTFSFKNFWLRRARRIMPALLLVLAVTLSVSSLICFPDTLDLTGLQCVATIALAANILLWKISGSYWAPQSEELSLLNTWSLSVEEQFYIFYPIAFLCLMRVRRYRTIIAWFTVVIGFFFCLYHSYKHPSAAFFFAPTRAWELGFGCAMALTPHPKEFKSHIVLVALLTIITSFFLYSDSSIFPGYICLLPVTATTLLIAFSHPRSDRSNLAFNLLKNKYIVYVGKISYSLYLWHWPVIVIGREWQRANDSSSYFHLILIPVLSVLSYHFIEQPGRKERRLVHTIIFSATLIIGGVSTYIAFFKPPPTHPPFFQPTVWMGNLFSSKPADNSQNDRISNLRMAGITQPTISYNPEILGTGGIIKPYGDELPSVVVLGSSHALMWAPVIDEICEELKTTVSIQAADGVPGWIQEPYGMHRSIFMTREEKVLFDEGRINSIIKWKPAIIIISDTYTSGSIDYYRRFLKNTFLSNTQVVFIEQPPILNIGETNAPRFVAWKLGDSVEGKALLEADNLFPGKSELQALANEFKNVETLDIADLYIMDNKCIVRDGAHILYTDNDHLSLYGAALAKSRIKTKLKKFL